MGLIRISSTSTNLQERSLNYEIYLLNDFIVMDSYGLIKEKHLKRIDGKFWVPPFMRRTASTDYMKTIQADKQTTKNDC